LTSRFVFPQLSLEGRRIWIVGLIPMERRIVLWGKFLFATVGSLLLSGGLILLSDLMLGLEGWIVTVHLFVLVCACCGLNGLAVGLGAVYPNLRSDNPSEIVSSFGGTLNLICSIVFVLGVLLTVAIPLYLEVIGVIKGQTFRVVLWIALGLIVVMTTIACLIPMKFGIRRFEQMDF
ncbi:MAG: hypothetical protein KGZ25_11580, partial [Planctomycetes bacterium]|nr:hypothetical protein [Planctomycetota bacterium]